MDYNEARILLNKSIGNIIYNIVKSKFKDIEKIDNDIRVIIDLEIVFGEIKNNIITIIDYIIDRFKIVDRDELMRIFIMHLFNDETKNCVLKISKFIPNTFFTKATNSEELLKLVYGYFTEKIIDCIFTPYIIDTLIELSDTNSSYIFKFIKKNWKIIFISSLTLIIIMIIGIKRLENIKIK
jgi:hypothetical protein